MQIFTGKVNLTDRNGLCITQLSRKIITAPELTLLRHIHGSEKVVDVKRLTDVEQTQRQERARLATKFKLEDIKKLFPGELPEEAPEIIEAADADVDLSDVVDDADLIAKVAASLEERVAAAAAAPQAPAVDAAELAVAAKPRVSPAAEIAGRKV